MQSQPGTGLDYSGLKPTHDCALPQIIIDRRSRAFPPFSQARSMCLLFGFFCPAVGLAWPTVWLAYPVPRTGSTACHACTVLRLSLSFSLAGFHFSLSSRLRSWLVSSPVPESIKAVQRSGLRRQEGGPDGAVRCVGVGVGTVCVWEEKRIK